MNERLETLIQNTRDGEYREELSLTSEWPFPFKGIFEWKSFGGAGAVPSYLKEGGTYKLFRITIIAKGPKVEAIAADDSKEEKRRKAAEVKRAEWFNRDVFDKIKTDIYTNTYPIHDMVNPTTERLARSSEYYGTLGWVGGVFVPPMKITRGGETYTKAGTLWVTEIQSDLMQNTGFLIPDYDDTRDNFRRRENVVALQRRKLMAEYEKLAAEYKALGGEEMPDTSPASRSLLRRRLGADQSVISGKLYEPEHAERSRYVEYYDEYMGQIAKLKDLVKEIEQLPDSEFEDWWFSHNAHIAKAVAKPRQNYDQWGKPLPDMADLAINKPDFTKKDVIAALKTRMADLRAAIEYEQRHTARKSRDKGHATYADYSAKKAYPHSRETLSDIEDDATSDMKDVLFAQLAKLDMEIDNLEAKSLGSSEKVYPELADYQNQIENYFDGWKDAAWNAFIYAAKSLDGGTDNDCKYVNIMAAQFTGRKWSARVQAQQAWGSTYDQRAIHKFNMGTMDQKITVKCQHCDETIPSTSINLGSKIYCKHCKKLTAVPLEVDQNIVQTPDGKPLRSDFRPGDWYHQSTANLEMLQRAKQESISAVSILTDGEHVPLTQSVLGGEGDAFWKNHLVTYFEMFLASVGKGIAELDKKDLAEAIKTCFRFYVDEMSRELVESADWQHNVDVFVAQTYGVDVSGSWPDTYANLSDLPPIYIF